MILQGKGRACRTGTAQRRGRGLRVRAVAGGQQHGARPQRRSRRRRASVDCKCPRSIANPVAGASKPKRAEQAVVAPAAAERLARAMRQNAEVHAGVIAEPARLAQIEAHARAGAELGQAVGDIAQAASAA